MYHFCLQMIPRSGLKIEKLCYYFFEMNNHIPFNFVIAMSIVTLMFYLAFANDDRMDLNVYEVPAKLVQDKVLPSLILGKENINDSLYNWEAGKDWQSTKKDRGFIKRLGSYNIKVEGLNIDCSITHAGGRVENNVNRWRTQVGLPELAEAEVQKNLEKRQCKMGDYFYMKLYNPDVKEKSISGAMYATKKGLLFVKFTGPTKAIKAYEKEIQSFTDSLALKQ
jgi:hypothetical protein